MSSPYLCAVRLRLVADWHQMVMHLYWLVNQPDILLRQLTSVSINARQTDRNRVSNTITPLRPSHPSLIRWSHVNSI
ncbi:hypothetical protein Plhal703r1_c18g0083851 [Plasmopara halstedii]